MYCKRISELQNGPPHAARFYDTPLAKTTSATPGTSPFFLSSLPSFLSAWSSLPLLISVSGSVFCPFAFPSLAFLAPFQSPFCFLQPFFSPSFAFIPDFLPFPLPFPFPIPFPAFTSRASSFFLPPCASFHHPIQAVSIQLQHLRHFLPSFPALCRLPSNQIVLPLSVKQSSISLLFLQICHILIHFSIDITGGIFQTFSRGWICRKMRSLHCQNRKTVWAYSDLSGKSIRSIFQMPPSLRPSAFYDSAPPSKEAFAMSLGLPTAKEENVSRLWNWR